MILHILNRSAFGSRVPDDMASALSPGDAIILIEDGVFTGMAPDYSRLETVRWHALREDVVSRGVEGRLADDIHLVDVDGFIRLTAEATSTISWF